MARILRIINRLNLGGPTLNVAMLTKYLAPEHETLLLAGMKDDTEASSEFILREMGLTPRYISSMYRSINLFNDLKAFLEIKKIVHSFRPHIVHTHAAKAGALGRLAAHQCKVPIIVHTFHGHVFHSYFHPWKNRIFITIERYLASITHRIIAVSELQKKELTEQFNICDPEKISVIPLGFDLNKFRQNMDQKRAQFRKEFNIDDDEIAIGIVGRLVPIKNHRMFLDVVRMTLNKSDRKLRFFIIGDGEEREHIISYATALQIPYVEHNFSHAKAPLTFTSWIKKIDYAYAGLDIVVLTSLNEGTPVSLIEAQASGKPVVSTDVGGVRDIVIEGSTGWLSAVNHTQQFVDYLIMLIENDTLRAQVAHRAPELVFQKFGHERLVQDVRCLYDELLQQRLK